MTPGLKARRSADVLIVGGGIVGAACARAFARQGLSVAVIEPGPVGGGATAAAMGHLLLADALDGSATAQAEHALTRRSLQLWDEWLGESGANKGNAEAAELARCGTLWIAADKAELGLALRKCAWLNERGIGAEVLGADALARAEPMLRPGLAGALLVPGDARIYPPKVAARWLSQARAEIIPGRVVGFDGHSVHLSCGRQLWGAMTVLCAGLASQRWLPPGSLVAKKGHLAITQQYPNTITHQLVELGYQSKAHAVDSDSVSFNVQPRPGRQILIGSSRQFPKPGQAEDEQIDMATLQSMLAHACSYLPALAGMNLLRCWTGQRPASSDGRPLIGAHPEYPRVWLATGHEGLGVSTALASAELLAELSLQATPTLSPEPWAPQRFFTA